MESNSCYNSAKLTKRLCGCIELNQARTIICALIIIKSVVMVFSKYAVNGCWKWGECSLPIVSTYSYLGIDFSRNGAWDMHNYKKLKLLDKGRKRVNQLHKELVISGRFGRLYK